MKRALDIIIHLQARLRMDVGGRPAQVLSEFYASIFAQILQASQSASQAKFEHAIECVRNVRDAWRQVAKDPAVNPAPLQVRSMSHPGRRAGSERIWQVEAGAVSQLERVSISSGDCELFFQLLLLVEAGVVAVEGQQFVVTAQLHNSAVVEHGDLVGIAHG